MKQSSSIIKAGLLAICISIIAIVFWELHLRNNGVPVAYDDNEALYADKRAMVYEPADKATVFIGSSRIKFDLNIPTWQKITGENAVQLANVGSSPRPVLEDLAADPNFKGKLVIDVTEGLFFTEGAFYDWKTKKKIAYYRDRTPTQRFSFQVDHVLESNFVFLYEDYYSINALLENLPIPPRPTVFSGNPFPMEFTPVSFGRQSFMTPRFVSDTNLQNQVKSIWTCGPRDPRPPITGHELDSVLNFVKSLVEQIKNRGGQVVFIRTPSSGPVFQGELKRYPRKEYWDKLISVTGFPGIYFTDYPAIAGFECPEWSHLSPAQAVVFTENLIKILEEKGWSFNKKTAEL